MQENPKVEYNVVSSDHFLLIRKYGNKENLKGWLSFKSSWIPLKHIKNSINLPKNSQDIPQNSTSILWKTTKRKAWHIKLFKGCMPQPLLVPFMNDSFQIIVSSVSIYVATFKLNILALWYLILRNGQTHFQNFADLRVRIRLKVFLTILGVYE